MTIAEPNQHDNQLAGWSTKELEAYERDLREERAVLWAAPVDPEMDYRLRVVEQILSDVRDQLWKRQAWTQGGMQA